MSQLTLIVVATAAAGVLSVLLAAVFLLLPVPLRGRVVPHLVSFAVGTLLAAAATGLLPEAFSLAGAAQGRGVALTFLGGLFAFFVLERFVIWRHCHAADCPSHVATSASAVVPLILVGDTVHNFVDGLLVGAACLTDARLGLLAAVAVAAHEVPQEVGDIAVMISSGLRPARALWLNVLSGAAMIAGGLAGYGCMDLARGVVPYALAVAAASFLYVGLADLVPRLHERPQLASTLMQFVSIATGVALVLTLQ